MDVQSKEEDDWLADGEVDGASAALMKQVGKLFGLKFDGGAQPVISCLGPKPLGTSLQDSGSTSLFEEEELQDEQDTGGNHYSRHLEGS